MKFKSTLREYFAMVSMWALLILPIGFVGGAQTAAAQEPEGTVAQIYDNGPLSTGATARNGSAAPAGSTWSEVSYDFGATTSVNTLAGVGCQQISTTTNNRCADDFNVPVGQTWTVNRVVVFGYQTNSVANPFIAANLRIWNGRPGDASSTIVFGDTTTNRMGTVTDSLLFRVFNSGPPNNTATGTTRRIWRIPIEVSPGLVLTAGNYWVDFQLNGGASGNFSPTTTITGIRGVPGMNSRQFIGTTSTWGNVIDDGSPVSAVDVPHDFPFKLEGSVSGAPAVPKSRTIDFDGDNKTDLAVARSASAAAQTTWLINNSGGTTAGVAWGLGAGQTGGDVLTPADFDGDGKTDIAVWRPTGTFYVLKSNGNVVDVDPFGVAGDDATVVGDYDGDGKADLAVYRPGAAASFWYQRSTVGGTGCSAAGACNNVAWGSTGDKAYPGDFDGDRKNDYSIIRNSGGTAVHYQLLSTAGYRTVIYGAFSDRFLTGDYDADGRTDFVAVRANAGNFDWYMTHSGNGQLFFFTYGLSGDFLTPGDHDGDKKTDFVLWRGGTYYPKYTSTSPVLQSWGGGTDVPVASSVNAH